MIAYEAMRDLAIAKGTCPDGYFGERASCLFAFYPDSGETIIVHDGGYHQSLLPPSEDVKEAMYNLSNHPVAQKYYKITSERITS